jgi:tetratricopeptide (TPR) repeat protein
MQTSRIRAQAQSLPSPQQITWTLCVTLLAAFLLFSPAQAQSAAAKQAQLDALYEELLVNPADIDKTLAYSRLAVDLGDYEAAIPPLERLLITSPDTPQLKLELGILYYLLGSYDVSREYLNDATQRRRDGSLPPAEVTAAANDYLNRM